MFIDVTFYQICEPYQIKNISININFNQRNSYQNETPARAIDVLLKTM